MVQPPTPVLPFPADQPQTDRDWLIMIAGKLDRVLITCFGPDGNGGLCQENKDIKRDMWIMKILLVLIMAGIIGRYIVLPGILPSLI